MRNTARIPTPDVGDIFHTTTLNGLYARALLVYVVSDKRAANTWSGVLMTKNGIEFVSSDNEHRGEYDWVPSAWTWDKDLKFWEVPEPVSSKATIPAAPKARKKGPKRIAAPAV